MWNFEPKRTIDFLRYRVPTVAVSVVFIIASLAALWQKGLDYGVDFMGGTEVQIKFAEAPPIEELRGRLGAVNLADSTLQRYGAAEDNEILVRTHLIEMDRDGAVVDAATVITGALQGEAERAAAAEGKINLNLAGAKEIAALWPKAEDGAENARAEEIARGIVSRRKAGLIRGHAELADLASEEEMSVLTAKTFLGSFVLQRVDRVGAKVGEDLRGKAVQATLWSLAAILVYMWFRFELRFGVAAVAALGHDALITLGALAWFDVSFDLTTVAAILTLLGYSINDSIVILDRVRENMALRRRDSFYDLLNFSVTQMLVRTILTIGFTFSSVLGLFLFAGESVRPFSFTLLVGMIVGTYSSYSVVLPTVYWWRRARPAVEKEG